jgi:hypothetical protein
MQTGLLRPRIDKNMPDTQLCTECGTPLPAYWPKGLCAQCAIDGALDMSHAGSQVAKALGHCPGGLE